MERGEGMDMMNVDLTICPPDKKGKKMRDLDLAEFIECFGEATQQIRAPESSLAKWKSVLPPILIQYWKDEGWAGYANGLFWTVNPR